MAVGKPSAEVESFRGKVPDEVFGEPFVPPVSDGSGQDVGCCATRPPLHLTDAGKPELFGPRFAKRSLD